jgi:hypothetical protein
MSPFLQAYLTTSRVCTSNWKSTMLSAHNVVNVGKVGAGAVEVERNNGRGK